MKALRILALVVGAFVLPAALAAATYLISASSFEAPAGAVPRVKGAIATPEPERTPRRDRGSDERSRGDDVSGPCDETEHADDPRCTGSGDGPNTSDDNSGSDDSGSDDSGSDNSGPGSDNSGPGSDDSGSDDSGSDNSGSGSDNSGSGSDNSGSGSDSSGSGSSGGDD